MPKQCHRTTVFLTCRGIEGTNPEWTLPAYFAILLFETPNTLLLFKPTTFLALLVVNSTISVTPTWIPMPNIPTFCFSISHKPDKLVDSTYDRSKSFVTLTPMWPLSETRNLRQPPFRHMGCVDGIKKPILITGKQMRYLHPSLWRSYLYTKVYHGHGEFASSTTHHHRTQCGQHC